MRWGQGKANSGLPRAFIKQGRGPYCQQHLELKFTTQQPLPHSTTPLALKVWSHTSSSSISWVHVRNTHSRAAPQTSRIRNSGGTIHALTTPPGDGPMSEFEKHCSPPWPISRSREASSHRLFSPFPGSQKAAGGGRSHNGDRSLNSNDIP